MANWIVELEPGVYLAPWRGDPGRTLEAKSALVYDSHPRARLALLAAQKLRPFERARVTLAPAPENHDCALKRGGTLCRECDLNTIAVYSKTPNAKLT